MSASVPFSCGDLRRFLPVGLLAVLLLRFHIAAAYADPPDVVFRRVYFDEGRPRMEASVPAGPAAAYLERRESMTGGAWQTQSVTRLPVEAGSAAFDGQPAQGRETSGFYRVRYANDGTLVRGRLRVLHNGYILTVNPARALSRISKADRYRFYVLNAVLIDPATGRIAAVYPPMEEDPPGSDIVARRARDVPELWTEERPVPIDSLPPAELLTFWEGQGVDPQLLADADFLDLKGGVVTPGLIDAHFHITSWSKKIPDPGEQFGFWADISAPQYYLDADSGTSLCTRAALWTVVEDACASLSSTNSGAPQEPRGVFLHGFLHARVDDPLPDGSPAPTYLLEFASGPGEEPRYNTTYLLNRIGLPPNGILDVPTNLCHGSEDEWPPLDYPTKPALLVHTSGQACWYNGALLEAFNAWEESFWGDAFDPLSVTALPPSGPDDHEWTFVASGTGRLFSARPPFPVDIVVSAPSLPTAHVPFQVVRMDTNALTLYAEPMLPDFSALVTNGPPASRVITPFYRCIPASITQSTWNAAAALYGVLPDTNGLSYGHWSPYMPYDSNWYNGAELGLIQYIFDAQGDVWRPTGYAEHYVMRDLLAATVLEEPSMADAMRHRRNLARWCHRHGLTTVHDIMFYRRRSNPYEFHAYEGLSYDRLLAGETEFFGERGMTNTVPTGRYFLRTGLYYYLENWEDIDKVLSLARPEDGGTTDQQSLAPPADHPEYPGWVRWLGWKLQFDGGTGARTVMSSAPYPKTTTTDPHTNANGTVFSDHTFGLSTMTSVQEPVFTSRESAALYWLVRESDPGHADHNDAIPRDWTILKSGLHQWVGLQVSETHLAIDLRALTNVVMTDAMTPTNDPAARMSTKVGQAFDQVNDAYERTLTALAKIWFEKSVTDIPSHVVTHCIGDAAVDLWLRAIAQIKAEVSHFPVPYFRLPDHWKNVITNGDDIVRMDNVFSNERYRVEHLINLSPHAIDFINNPSNGINSATTPSTRNVGCSTQPSLLLLDGVGIATSVFPADEDLWPIPNGGISNFWRGLPAVPRSPHHMPCPLYMDADIPFTLNTDPPSVRDPRPALTVVASVARTPVQLDPSRWLDQDAEGPEEHPRDYLVGVVHPPLGKRLDTNPMQLSVEEALCSMTFWGAHVSGMEREVGAIAPPTGSDHDGWFADMVVWQRNPLAIRSEGGLSITNLAAYPPDSNEVGRVEAVNDFIRKFRPALTIVGGVPVYADPGASNTWQALR